MSSPAGLPPSGSPLDRRRQILFWIFAIAIMLVAGAYQRRTGPTYELKGRTALGDVTVRWVLTRSSSGLSSRRWSRYAVAVSSSAYPSAAAI